MQVVIYKTPDCPRCRVLAAHLERLGIDFEARDMTLPAVLTELRCDVEAGYVEEVLRR